MHAKHIYHSILIIAAAGATACSSESNAPEPAVEAQELSFQANTDTRASVVTTMNTPFEVYGEFAKTGDPAASHTQLFNATPVSLSGGKWTYGTPEYWMPGNTYSFIALHPASTGVTGLTEKAYNIDSQQLSFTYTLPTDYTDATDLLAATHRRKYTTGTTTPVTFNFTHLLARLNFTAKVDPAVDATITLHSITISGLSPSASYKLKPATIAGGSNETDDKEEASWTLGDSPRRISYTKNITGTVINKGEQAEFFPVGSDPLMIIPQPVTTDIEILLTYSKDGDQPTTISGKLRSATVSHNYRWAAGQSYNYSFTLGADGLLLFGAPNINNWDEDEGGNYIIMD